MASDAQWLLLNVVHLAFFVSLSNAKLVFRGGVPVDFIELTEDKKGIPSRELRERVEAARKIQRLRYKGFNGISCNAQMTSDLIKEYCELENDSKALLKKAYDKYGYSARVFDKFLKVARTFADLDGSSKIRKKDIANVLLARDLDKEKTRMYTV